MMNTPPDTNRFEPNPEQRAMTIIEKDIASLYESTAVDLQRRVDIPEKLFASAAIFTNHPEAINPELPPTSAEYGAYIVELRTKAINTLPSEESKSDFGLAA